MKLYQIPPDGKIDLGTAVDEIRVDEIEDVNRDEGESRRGVLKKMIAASAAFATGLFVSNRAEANCWCPTCDFGAASWCFFHSGLCWSSEFGVYVHTYNIYEGSPHQGCCINYGGQICFQHCSFDHIHC